MYDIVTFPTERYDIKPVLFSITLVMVIKFTLVITMIALQGISFWHYSFLYRPANSGLSFTYFGVFFTEFLQMSPSYYLAFFAVSVSRVSNLPLFGKAVFFSSSSILWRIIADSMLFPSLWGLPNLILALLALGLQTIPLFWIFIKIISRLECLASCTLNHSYSKIKSTFDAICPCCHALSKRQRCSIPMIAEYLIVGNYLVRDSDIIAQMS